MRDMPQNSFISVQNDLSNQFFDMKEAKKSGCDRAYAEYFFETNILSSVSALYDENLRERFAQQTKVCLFSAFTSLLHALEGKQIN